MHQEDDIYYDEGEIQEDLLHQPGTAKTFLEESNSQGQTVVTEQMISDQVVEVEGQWFCKICHRKSSSVSNCRRHVKFCHFDFSEEKKCRICGLSFKRNQRLKEHLKEKHHVLF